MLPETSEDLSDDLLVPSKVQVGNEDVVEVDHDISGQDRSWKMLFIMVWKVTGELVRPKYITRVQRGHGWSGMLPSTRHPLGSGHC